MRRSELGSKVVFRIGIVTVLLVVALWCGALRTWQAKLVVGGHRVVQVEIPEPKLARAMVSLYVGNRAHRASTEMFARDIEVLLDSYRAPGAERRIGRLADRLVTHYRGDVSDE